MIVPNPILGTGLHALGGIAASACYTPSNKLKNWSWETFWLVQSLFAWIIMPILLGIFTVPNFFEILSNASSDVVWGAFLLGAVYGFGGMAFGLSIKHIGYSLTYTISIGISAALGTIIPLLLKGTLVEYFSGPGSSIIIIGMLVSVVGVALCGWAGFCKEKDLRTLSNGQKQFKMLGGLLLALFSGVLSAVFNISLEHGQPISDMAAQQGAGVFEGNAKMIVSTSGCFVVNIIWFLVLSIKQKSLVEFTAKSGIPFATRCKNFGWSALAGALWSTQFFFYGLGHVHMGRFQFISWVLHMSMLIFFSFIVGLLLKEWKDVTKRTYLILLLGLVVLVASFIIMTMGSVFAGA